MMTVDDIKKVLKTLTANYGEEFYKGTNSSDVVKLWAVQFANDDPKEVMQAVQNCIATLSYKPKIADIRRRMAANRMQGQMTVTEAFQEIHKAVKKSGDRESATKAYNELAPILRKVVGDPAFLRGWHQVSEETFQTVIMSAIRESYREIAQQEFDYYALPKPLQAVEKWRVNAPDLAELPEPEKQKTHEERFADMDADAKAYREKYLQSDRTDMTDKINAFIKPMTDDELKLMEAKQKRDEAIRMERMRS